MLLLKCNWLRIIKSESLGKNFQQVRSGKVSLTPLRNPTVPNTEELFRSNERRSRLTLHKQPRSVASSQSTESESFTVTAGTIHASATLKDFEIPDVPDFDDDYQ